MDRRGFFGWIGSLASAWCVSKILPEKKQTKEIPQGKWPVDYFAYATNIWKSYNLNKPNPDQTPSDFIDGIVKQWEATEIALVWPIVSPFKKTMEVYVIPTATAIPHPANPGYPHGYYRIVPPMPNSLTYEEVKKLEFFIIDIPANQIDRHLAPQGIS